MIPAVHQPAPALAIRSVGKLPVTLESFSGQPVVLAFVAKLGDASERPRALSRIRAELRGMAAVMMVVAGDRVWWFRPDDELELFARAPDLDLATIQDARIRYGVTDTTGELTALTLFVIDGDRRVRFARKVTPSSHHVLEVLEQALRLAGGELVGASAKTLLVSRREMVVLSLVTAFAAVLAEACGARPMPVAASSNPSRARHEVEVTLRVNGQDHPLLLEPRVSLLDALRERLELTGTKKGCDHGQCGACTVLAGGRRINACLTLAVMVDRTEITTIEGLGDLAKNPEGSLHPMQAAFAAEDALQCGYCTPGQIMSAIGLVRENRAHSDDEVREEMSGNICRCGAYGNIVAAIQRGRGQAAT